MILKCKSGVGANLGAVESQHLRSEKVFTASEVCWESELVFHGVGHHNFVGPLAVDIIDLIDLEPFTDTGGGLGAGDGSKEGVDDWSWMGRAVPLNLDLTNILLDISLFG